MSLINILIYCIFPIVLIVVYLFHEDFLKAYSKICKDGIVPDNYIKLSFGEIKLIYLKNKRVVNLDKLEIEVKNKDNKNLLLLTSEKAYLNMSGKFYFENLKEINLTSEDYNLYKDWFKNEYARLIDKKVQEKIKYFTEE